MHKGIDNYKDNCYYLKDVKKAIEENRTVFLDIDGVIQPRSQKRFDHDNEYLKKYLYEKYDDERYLEMMHYDAGAVYYDWRPSSVGFLRELLDTTYSHIVLSSDWRSGHSFEELKAFFKMYDLDDYLIDRTPFDNTYKKFYTHESSIKEYLSLHPEIKKYIVLDDINLYEDFGENFRLVNNMYNSLGLSDYEYARFVLNNNPEIRIENNVISFADFIMMHFNIIEEDNYKIMYIDSIYNKYNSLNIDLYITYILAYMFKRYVDINEFIINDSKYKFNDLGIGYKDSFGCLTVVRDYYESKEHNNLKTRIFKKI